MIQKTVVITGAGIGIGRATALAFARRGYEVVVTDILESEGRSVVKEIEAEGGRGRFYKLDVTDSAAVDGVVREVESLNNGIDVVVANSGIAHRVPLAEMTDAKWDLIMDVDLKGVLRIVRAAAPGMKARPGHHRCLVLDIWQHLRLGRACPLFGRQSRCHRPRPGARSRTGTERHPGERRRAGRYPDGASSFGGTFAGPGEAGRDGGFDPAWPRR